MEEIPTDYEVIAKIPGSFKNPGILILNSGINIFD